VITYLTEKSTPDPQAATVGTAAVTSAELLSVGTELLLGEIIDTNAAYLARELKARGVQVQHKLVVGDNLGRIVAGLRQALGRADMVVVGGGLGPTDDDLSREAIAEVVGETPSLDTGYLAKLEGFFAQRQRHMPEQNRKQAWVLPSGTVLANPIGTAPGWLVQPKSGQWANKTIVALPGPPRELQRMWQEQVVPHLHWPEAALATLTLRTVGLGESHIAERLADLTQAANPSVATYARRDGVHVRVAASAASAAAAQALLEPVLAVVRDRLRAVVYGFDEQSLPQVVIEALAARGDTVAAMESLSGGLLLDELTNIPGASAVVAGGIVGYTNASKVAFGVHHETIAIHGAISEPTALEMAYVAKTSLASTWGVALTGVAGPQSSEDHAVGTVCIAVVGPGIPKVNTLLLGGDRRTIKERAVFAALGMLWRALQDKDDL
jgi:nicotinamide-nucleotide amidase